MIATPAKMDVPLRTDEGGAIRVGDTRVLLYLVIHAFNQGESAEGIVDMYSSLKLADVYAVIAYYLYNRETVNEYIQQKTDEAEAFRREYEAANPPTLTREILVARLEAQRKKMNREL